MKSRKQRTRLRRTKKRGGFLSKLFSRFSRKKIEKDSCSPDEIQSLHGMSYNELKDKFNQCCTRNYDKTGKNTYLCLETNMSMIRLLSKYIIKDESRSTYNFVADGLKFLLLFLYDDEELRDTLIYYITALNKESIEAFDSKNKTKKIIKKELYRAATIMRNTAKHIIEKQSSNTLTIPTNITENYVSREQYMLEYLANYEVKDLRVSTYEDVINGLLFLSTLSPNDGVKKKFEQLAKTVNNLSFLNQNRARSQFIQIANYMSQSAAALLKDIITPRPQSQDRPSEVPATLVPQ